MRRSMTALVGMLMAMSHIDASAQSSSPKNATDVTRAELDTLITQFPGPGDQQLRVADAGRMNIGIAIVRWTPGARGGLMHVQVTEVYYMLEGTGTLVTGGVMPGGTSLPAEGEIVKLLVGPSVSGATIQDGQSRKIGPGDVVVIPAGVPHQWATIDADMKYLVVRVDPEKVLPSGYVHPALKN